MKNLIKAIIPISIKKLIKFIQYGGSKYYCPICDTQSRKLLPMGRDNPVIIEKQIIGAGLRNASCYKCHSTDRERLIYTYITKELNILNSPNLRILHIAPEQNITEILLNKKFDEYICGDLFTEGYTYPSHVENMNLLNLHFEDNYFDIIICNHVLEHITDDEKAIKELYRVLKQEGEAIMQVPISNNTDITIEKNISDPAIRETVYGQFDHVRIYGQDYVQRLKSIGFNVLRKNISEKYPDYGLNMNEDLFIGYK